MSQMNKNTPLLIFTGLAVAAAGTFGAVVTGTWPVQQEVVAEAPAVETAPAVSQPAVEAPKPAETEVATAPAQETAAVPAKPAEPAAAVEAPKPNPDVPAFDTVNVMPTGEAVIAGHAKPGSEVIVKFAGVEVGKATAGSDGSFALVPEKPLPTGAGALTLETVIDGKVIASQDQIAIVVDQKKPALVAKVDPDAPTKVVQVPSSGEAPKEVQLSAVDYDAAGNIVFQGRVTPGGTVRFYVDNQVVGDATADAAGNWQFMGAAPIAAGTHTLRADEIDSTGKVLSRAEIPFLREEVEKVIAATQAPAVQQVPAAEQATQANADTQEAATAVQPAADTPAMVQAPATEVPASAVVVAAATADRPSRIIIQPGNNLWRISREVYGKGKMFTVIWEANRDLIKNPNRIYPGQILTAPKT
jgi:nucleoid-associated protein YgaU